MEIVSSGEVFREMADERDMSLKDFSELAEDSEDIDRKLDERMIEKAEGGRILEGRLTGHLLNRSDKKAYKVWLKAPLEIRAKRIADRESANNDLKKIRDRVKKREKSERKRYQQYYDIDLSDTSIYDLVIDSDKYSPGEIVDEIMEGALDEIREE